ncbi:hypothetical protein NQ314_006267 [Rhamnusium bicolor]|uniref:Uncharacterized protein n=1 Tax=Rhamnusium bicolor TaxID=1586634 RepID=A0AAV8Z8X1_9CUCU|nr:hypothetical protein NQ314_006267 [Rhamnusium bicolor]
MAGSFISFEKECLLLDELEEVEREEGDLFTKLLRLDFGDCIKTSLQGDSFKPNCFTTPGLRTKVAFIGDAVVSSCSGGLISGLGGGGAAFLLYFPPRLTFPARDSFTSFSKEG